MNEGYIVLIYIIGVPIAYLIVGFATKDAAFSMFPALFWPIIVILGFFDWLFNLKKGK